MMFSSQYILTSLIKLSFLLINIVSYKEPRRKTAIQKHLESETHKQNRYLL